MNIYSIHVRVIFYTHRTAIVAIYSIKHILIFYDTMMSESKLCIDTW